LPIREHLKALAQAGRIAIGLSYHVVFELLQDAAESEVWERASPFGLVVKRFSCCIHVAWSR
jgi:hypothetical protein